MLTKEKIIQSISDLPDEFSLDELVEKLIILEKIEIGLQQVEEGKVIYHTEVKNEFINNLIN